MGGGSLGLGVEEEEEERARERASEKSESEAPAIKRTGRREICVRKKVFLPNLARAHTNWGGTWVRSDWD